MVSSINGGSPPQQPARIRKPVAGTRQRGSAGSAAGAPQNSRNPQADGLLVTLHERLRELATREDTPREVVVQVVVETVLRERLGRSAVGDPRFPRLVADVVAAIQESEPLLLDLDILRRWPAKS